MSNRGVMKWIWNMNWNMKWCVCTLMDSWFMLNTRMHAYGVCVCVSMNIWEWRCDCCVHVSKWILVLNIINGLKKNQQKQSNNLKTTNTHSHTYTNWKWPKWPGPFVSFTLRRSHSRKRWHGLIKSGSRKQIIQCYFFVYCLLHHSFTCSIRALITISLAHVVHVCVCVSEWVFVQIAFFIRFLFVVVVVVFVSFGMSCQNQ